MPILPLPPPACARVRAYAAARFPEFARQPSFDAVIQLAVRTDMSVGEKGQHVGYAWRRVLACAVLQAELEAQALDIPIRTDRMSRT